MKISIDTKEDSHDEIRKVIKMLQNLVGETQEIFTNQPIQPEANSAEAGGTAFANIFSDNNLSSEEKSSQQPQQEQSPQAQAQETGEISESTEDLFAELFSEEELKKMDAAKIKDAEEQEEVKPKKKYSIELY